MKDMEDIERRVVLIGTWFYDKIIPKKIMIYSMPAKYSYIRYDDLDELVESVPIPETPNGHIYKTSFGGEEHTLEKIKEWADAQPWEPCVWHE